MAALLWVFILQGFHLLQFSAANTDDFNSTFARTNESDIDFYEDNNLTDLINSTASPSDVTPTLATEVSTTTASTTSTITESTPSASPQPLPLSGTLPSPVTNAASLCPCNLQQDECDVSCCCDRDCSGEQLSLFTSCSVQRVSGDARLCRQDVTSYSLSTTVDGYSQLETSVQQGVNTDVFCIQSTNLDESGLSLATPKVPTTGNFDVLVGRFRGFFFGSPLDDSTTVEPQTSPGYLYGDAMATEEEGGERGMFRLPASSVTAHCSDLNPAAFLQDQTSRCSRRLVLEKDCTTLQALNMHTYTDPRILSRKTEDAVGISVEVTAISLQSLEGTQTQLDLTGDLELTPALLPPQADSDSAVCTNVVLQVVYVVRYSQWGDVVNVRASLVLGAIDVTVLPLEQTFKITFVQEQEQEKGPLVHFSGNPGYVVGLPLLAGSRTADGIVQSADPRGGLTLLQSSGLQDCFRGPHPRTPILFGVDMVSGCTLRLEETTNCSWVSEVVLGVLRGQTPPQYVASFGNSAPDTPLDWVPIRNLSRPTDPLGCSVPLSVHLEVRWSQYGTLLNPQPQIVSVTQVIYSNTSSLDSLSGGGQVLPVTSSVSFLPVSANARPGYKAPPTIDAKLPYDFFFPFV